MRCRMCKQISETDICFPCSLDAEVYVEAKEVIVMVQESSKQLATVADAMVLKEAYANSVKIVCEHPFKTTPFAHQLKAWNLSKDAVEFALFMDMGTGKSKVAIDTAAYLYMKGEIDTLVVLGNKGSYKNWVINEIPAHMPDCIPTLGTYWESSPNLMLQTTYDMMGIPIKSLKIFVMNIEAVAFKKAFDVVSTIVSQNKTMIVIDESTTIKNEHAQRTKAAIKLGTMAKYRRILTGEPISNSPLDIWAQAKFLSPGLLGFSSFFSFKSYYAKLGEMRSGYRQFKVVNGYKNLKELETNIAKWSFRIKKEECLDLPPKVYQTYTITMPPEQKRMYDALKEESAIALSAESIVTTPLAITKLLRLHQLACGHLVDDLGKVLTVNNNRISALQEILEECSGKVIIWATYRKDIEMIANTIKKEYGDDSIVSYFGDTSIHDREDAVTEFQNRDSPVRFFLGNPKTGGYGLTLTAATTVVYYSNNYELEVRLQSEDRCHRIGQTQSVTYIDIVTEGTVDEKIIKALRCKKKVSAEVLGDTWREWI